MARVSEPAVSCFPKQNVVVKTFHNTAGCAESESVCLDRDDVWLSRFNVVACRTLNLFNCCAGRTGDLQKGEPGRCNSLRTVSSAGDSSRETLFLLRNRTDL